MKADRKFLVAAVGYTALVGLLVGVLGQLTSYSPPLIGGLTYLTTDASDLAARLAVRVVDGALLLAVACYLLVPLYALVGAPADDRRRSLVGASVALLGLPVVWVLVGLVFLRLRPSDVALTLVGALVVVGVLALVSRLGGRLEDAVPAETAPVGAMLGVLLLSTLLVGGVAGTAVDDPLVESFNGHAPQATFDYEYDRTGDGAAVVTVRHAGGDRLPVENVHVVSDGFADVRGANQVEAGSWQGSTTVEDGDRFVARGNAVTVGVRDCEHVRVVWRTEATSVTIGIYDCPASR